MLPEISRVLWSCDGACTLPLYLLEVCVCACVPVWAAADRSWGTETDKAAGGCAGITFTSSRKTTVKKKTRAGWAKLEAGLSSNVWHVVLFKAESSRAGNHTAVGILCPAMITLVGGVGVRTEMHSYGWEVRFPPPPREGRLHSQASWEESDPGSGKKDSKRVLKKVFLADRDGSPLSVRVIHAGSKAVMNVLWC